MRAVLYVRVSTDEQAKSGYSIPDQLRTLRHYAKSNGFEIIDELVDDGYSGADPHRPGLLRVYDLAESGSIDTVLAAKRDRLFRSRLLRLLADRGLEDFGVKLVALNDTNNRIGDRVQDDYAEYERELFAERSRAGKRQKARDGKTSGSGTPPYGFKYGPDRRSLEVDNTTMPIVRRIFEMIADGETMYGVSKMFNDEGVPPMRGERWYTVSMKRTIWNDAYKGVWYYGRERVTTTPAGKNKRKHTANPQDEWIGVPVPDSGIPHEVIDRARENLTKNYRPRKASQHYYELKGLVFCGSCGLRMTTYTADGYRYYVCQKRRKWGRGACEGALRSARTNPERKRGVGLEDEVISYVQDLISNPAKLTTQLDAAIAAESARNPEKDVTSWVGVVEDCDRKRAAYQDQQAVGLMTLDELADKLRALEGMKATAEDHLANARAGQDRAEERRPRRKRC